MRATWTSGLCFTHLEEDLLLSDVFCISTNTLHIAHALLFCLMHLLVKSVALLSSAPVGLYPCTVLFYLHFPVSVPHHSNEMENQMETG